MKYFKVKLRFRDSQRAGGPHETWLAVRARSIGEAVVIADNRCLDAPFELDDDPASEISEQEYYRILNDARHRRGIKDFKAETRLSATEHFLGHLKNNCIQ